MAFEPAPAFQFYVDDWLSSSSVAAMTPEARGCYIMLLCYFWRDQVIADDDATLAALARIPVARWTRLRDSVLKPCTLTPDGWINERVEQVRQEMRAHRQAKKLAGSKGAEKRWHSHASAIPPATALPIANDSSSSSSPSPVQTPTVSVVRPAPLGARSEHRTHAVCGRVCLPAFLFREFCGLQGGDDPDAAVRAWALGVLRAIDPEGPRGRETIGDALAFWRREWATTHQAPAEPELDLEALTREGLRLYDRDQARKRAREAS